VNRLVLLGAALLLATACASTPQDVNRDMQPHLDSGDVARALAILESSRDAYDEKNDFLYWLEEGMLRHYNGQWAESNASFEQAKRAAEANYTKSISRELGTYMVNDTTVPYYGSSYERTLIHLVAALNYAALGQTDIALVEFRQLDAFSRKLEVDRAPGTFQDDAFGRYLGGMFYAEEGQADEAFISYKHALEAYAAQKKVYGVRRPKRLVEDARRVAASLGRWAEDDLAKRVGKRRKAPALPTDAGRLVLVHYNGRAPYKVQDTLNITVGQGWAYVNQIEGGRPNSDKMATAQGAATGALSRESFQFALPRYVRVAHRIAASRLTGPGVEVTVSSEQVSAYGTTVVQALADDIAWIRIRAIARAAIKYVLARIAEEAAREAGGDAVGLVTAIGLGIARNVSEVADLRTWYTAPDEIELLEAPLAAGTYQLDVRFVDATGKYVGSQTLSDVVIEPGRRTFRVVRTTR
jgi:tetratricopeptide (TPR) repeat protein